MCLPRYTSECSARHFSMLWNCRRYHAVGYGLGKLNIAARLCLLVEARFQKFASDLAIEERFHAAISNSKCRTFGSKVATGGVKCNNRASLRFSMASSSVLPCDATSTSRHWATYHSLSLNITALKSRFIHAYYHNFWQRHFVINPRFAAATRLYTISLSTGSNPARSIIEMISCLLILLRRQNRRRSYGRTRGRR